MKASLSIAAALLILATCLFLVLRSRIREEPRPEIVASREAPAAVTGRSAEAPVSAKGVGEIALPASEEKEKPPASVSGSVLDEKDAPVPFAEVL